MTLKRNHWTNERGKQSSSPSTSVRRHGNNRQHRTSKPKGPATEQGTATARSAIHVERR